MQRRKFIRKPSFAARLALPPAVLSLMLFWVASAAHWFGVLTSKNYTIVLTVAFALGTIAILLAMLGLKALWKNAAIGGRRSFFALLMAAPIVSTGLLAAVYSQITPRISDVSTDVTDPPHFLFATRNTGIDNQLEPPKLNSQAQAEYAGLSGRRYSLSADLVSVRISSLVEANGWKAATPFPVRNGQNEWLIEAEVRTPVLGFRDFVAIRVTEEGEAAYVDMRSASGFGQADLGANANRIRRFMKDLDSQISLGTSASQ